MNKKEASRGGSAFVWIIITALVLVLFVGGALFAYGWFFKREAEKETLDSQPAVTQDLPSGFKWKFELDSGMTSPVTENGVVYCGTYKSSYALDAKTGRLKWRFRYKGDYSTRHHIYSPKVSGKNIYIKGWNGVYVLDKKTGRVKWSLNDLYLFPKTVSNSMGFSAARRQIVAFDTKTGRRKWRVNMDRGVYSLEHSNGSVFYEMAHLGRNAIIGSLDANTGDKEWEIEPDSTYYVEPVVGNGSVCFKRGREFGQVIVGVDRATGQQRWASETVGKVDKECCIFSGGTVYASSQESADSEVSIVYAFDGATGQKKWGARVGDEKTKPMIASGGMLYLESGEGIHALNTETGGEVWDYTPTGGLLHVGTVHRGLVYVIARHRSLTALDAETGEKVWDTDETINTKLATDGEMVFFGDVTNDLFGLVVKRESKR